METGSRQALGGSDHLDVHNVPDVESVRVGRFIIPSNREFAEWLAQELTIRGISAARFDLILALGEGRTMGIMQCQSSPTLLEVVHIINAVQSLDRKAVA